MTEIIPAIHHFHHQAYGFTSFFILGLVGSLHCIGMCGPLSALWIGKNQKKKWHLMIYHTCRMVSYFGFGLLFYLFGMAGQHWLHSSIPLVVFLIFAGLVLFDFKIPWPRWVTKLEANWLQKIPQSWAWMKASLLGFFTPFLPCGLLYAAFSGVGMAHNAATAMLWMFAFALGTFPLLFLAQSGVLLSIKKIPARIQTWAYRILAILSLSSIFLMRMFHTHHHS